MITGLLRHKEQEKARGITAGDLMTGPAVTVGAEDTVQDAARIMYKRKVKRLPVIDEDGHLVGIISRTDILSVFSRSDEEIRKEITGNVILDGFLTDPDTFTVAVKDGVVTLTGVPENNELGHEIVRRVRHVQGVVAVRDRLSYPPPELADGPFGPGSSFPLD
jgi:CBS-domain-containing membrane protein